MSLPQSIFFCPFSLDLPRQPVEGLCCHNIFCEECSINNQIVNGNCPLCRAHPFLTQQSEVARRLVSNIKDQRIIWATQSNTDPRACWEPKCNFSTRFKPEALEHLTIAHSDQVWNNFTRVSKAGMYLSIYNLYR